MNRLHFIAGLPRSGTTLLAAILRQNPNFHAAMSSPLRYVFSQTQQALSAKNQSAIFINNEQRKNVLRGLFENFYSDATHKVVFDTNWYWTGKVFSLFELFTEAKMICCVRDISWIMDSIERALRDNPHHLSGIFNFEPETTVYTRLGGIARSDGMVGKSLDYLREAFYSKYSEKLLFVNYETLASNPEIVMTKIYDFIQEKHFTHDYDNISYMEPEFDALLGMPRLHTVKRKVELVFRKTILPPDLFAHYQNDKFWMKSKHSVAMI